MTEINEETKAPFTVRPLEREDRQWVAHFLDAHWSTTQIVSRGRAVYGHLLPGFVAELEEDGKLQQVGLLTYNHEGDSCEITTLNSIRPNLGIGTALVETLKEHLKMTRCKRVWVITTNDNLEALKFWQKQEFHLVQIHQNAVEQARRIKPQIPITGLHGIPVRDEIELEYHL